MLREVTCDFRRLPRFGAAALGQGKGVARAGSLVLEGDRREQRRLQAAQEHGLEGGQRSRKATARHRRAGMQIFWLSLGNNVEIWV